MRQSVFSVVGLVSILLLVLLFPVHVTHASHTSTKDAASTTATSTNQKYAIPIPILLGVTLADLTPNFGDPRDGGRRIHEGLDIMAPSGTPIVSPVKGTIAGMGSAENPGKYVYVRGSDGYTYVFMHLDEFAKLRRGQKIKVGDTLGTVGQTGNAQNAGPHLHFEIRKKSKPIDPFPRLTKEFTLEEKIGFLNASVSALKSNKKMLALVISRYSGLLLLADAEGMKLNKSLTTPRTKAARPQPVASTTVGTGRGAEGEGVKALQRALVVAHLGPEASRLAVAGTTGYFGVVTEAALKEFQRMNALPATGMFDAATKSIMTTQFNF